MPNRITVSSGAPSPFATEDQRVTVRITGLPASPNEMTASDRQALEAALITFALGMDSALKSPTDRPDKRTHTYWTLEADVTITYATAGVLGNQFHTHVVESRSSPGDHCALPRTDRD